MKYCAEFISEVSCCLYVVPKASTDPNAKKSTGWLQALSICIGCTLLYSSNVSEFAKLLNNLRLPLLFHLSVPQMEEDMTLKKGNTLSETLNSK